MLQSSNRVKILRLKPRFGPTKKNLNDITVNFDYLGQMICELQIRLGSGKTPLLYYSNHFVYEIERVCNSRERYKLFEAYNKASRHPTKHHLTIDSDLINSTDYDEKRQTEEIKMREEATEQIPFMEKVLKSNRDSF